MRSISLVILSIVFLAGSFFVYARVETGKLRSTIDGPVAVVPPPPPPKNEGPAQSPFEAGQGAWLNTYDEKGLLKDRFRGANYAPQDSGVVLVQKPVAEFFMGSEGSIARLHHEMMRLTGTTGDVVMPQGSSPGGSTLSPNSGTPRRGRIHNCRVDLFNLFPDSDPAVPDEQIWINNVQFDNETMLITTESFADGDHDVPADQVPVKLRGKKYDFDGRGLRLRWNDKDGRLELLEVEHGEQLVVKDASTVSGMMGPADSKNRKSPVAPRPGPTAQYSHPLSYPLSNKHDIGGNEFDENRMGLVRSFTDPKTQGMGFGHPQASPLPEALATADRSGIRLVLGTAASGPTSRTAKPPSPPIPYFATFYDDVRITQGPEVLITAEKMQVDFTTRRDSPSAVAAADAAADAPSLGAAWAARPRVLFSSDQLPGGMRPLFENGETSVGEARATPCEDVLRRPAAATNPATQPAPAPVIIRWTGKLVMVPSPADRPKLAAGDAVVELTGSPCEIIRTSPLPGDDIRAAQVVYHTADGSIKLVNSERAPLVVISKMLDGQVDPRTTVTTQRLEYSTDAAGRKVALLWGPGHATVPLESKNEKQDKSKKPGDDLMDARWTQGARVYFAGGKLQDNQTIQQLDLFGDVDVKHPQLVMQSQVLSLHFEPPDKPVDKSSGPSTRTAGGKSASQPELKSVIASDTVHCEIAGQNGKRQKIDCNRLDMETARTTDGKFYAHKIEARGAVHAFDGEQDLRASTVFLTLRPAATKPIDPATRSSARTRPSRDDSDSAAVELEKMTAADNVVVINKDGSKATGSLLKVTTDAGGNHVRLTGSPLASVIDARNNVISGPVITFDPKDGVARVIGAGNMHVLQEQTDGSKPRPMDIAWIDRADMNGPANRIDVLGDVIVKTVDSEGAVNTATADRVKIDLMKKVASAPAIFSPAATATTRASHAATRPAKDTPATAMEMDAIKDKDVRTVTLFGNAKVKSVLVAANGAVSRQFVIVAPTVIYQLADSEQLPAKSLWVPCAGQMFLGDHHPSEKPKAGAKQDDVVGGKGNTAFKWERMLVYKDVDHTAVMTGDVVIVHQPEGNESADGPVRINADSVTAVFDPKKPPAATTGPASKQPDSSMQLAHLTADGHITVTRGQTVLTADQIEYDPATHWMTAHGTHANPAHYENAEIGSSKSFDDLSWNTVTWNFKAAGPRVVNPR
jgi:hypothetical protein